MSYPLHPEHPAWPIREVHVWRATKDAIPADRMLGRVMLLYLEGNPEEPRLSRDERGKPRLANDPGELAINLSHSGELLLAAVTRGREVGVDVERAKPERDLVGIAARAFQPVDARAVREATGEDRTRLFYELWTRHEARLKCLGVGLAGESTEPAPPVAVENLPVDPGYAAAVAVTGAAVTIRRWTLCGPRPIAG